MKTVPTSFRPQAVADAVAMRLLDETLLDLCKIPSPIGEEDAICDAVQARLSKLGERPIRRYGNSLVVPVSRGQGPKVALVGHLDTVRTENGPPKISQGRCHGAGASDMKSGLALMIAVAELIDPSKMPYDVTLVFYAREEGPYAENELGPVLAADPELGGVDLAVCMEPSDNKLHLGCTGSVHAQVSFRGRTAHSARPWEGENAITNAAAFIAEVGALAPRESVLDGLTYRSVTTITQARDGGRGRNVVPDQFVVNLNHRFAPDLSIEWAKAYVEQLVDGRAKVEFTDLSPGAAPSASHPLVKHLMGCGVRAVEPKQAWTDVARFASRGIAAVNFGPGENAQAHQRNESTSLALVHEGFGILRRWLLSAPEGT
jgi:succinyl-diaminopimelate desuccinylase